MTLVACGMATVASISTWGAYHNWRFSDEPNDWAVWLAAIAGAVAATVTTIYVMLTYKLLRVTLAAADATRRQAEAAIEAVTTSRELWRIERLEQLVPLRDHLFGAAETLARWWTNIRDHRDRRPVPQARDDMAIQELDLFVTRIPAPTEAEPLWVSDSLRSARTRVSEIVECAERVDLSGLDPEERAVAMDELIDKIGNAAFLYRSAAGVLTEEIQRIALAARPQPSSDAEFGLRQTDVTSRYARTES